MQLLHTHEHAQSKQNGNLFFYFEKVLVGFQNVKEKKNEVYS